MSLLRLVSQLSSCAMRLLAKVAAIAAAQARYMLLARGLLSLRSLRLAPASTHAYRALQAADGRHAARLARP